MLLNCGVGEHSRESLGLQVDPTSQSERKSVLNIHWKNWCWSCNTLATWCEELTHWRRPWCWARLKAGEWDDRGWDAWMASTTRWIWVWASSRIWWWAGNLACYSPWGCKGSDMTKQLNWTVEASLALQYKIQQGKANKVLPRDLTDHSKHHFEQHKRQLYRWTSPHDLYGNQINYILCSRRWWSFT